MKSNENFKKTMVEEDERLNKEKKKALMTWHKKSFVKLILKLPLLYNSKDRHCFWF